MSLNHALLFLYMGLKRVITVTIEENMTPIVHIQDNAGRWFGFGISTCLKLFVS